MNTVLLRRTIQSVLVVLLALALIVPLSACGKKGDLDNPECEKTQYPRTYPQ